MDISTTRQLSYEMHGLMECAATIAYLYDWKIAQEPKAQLIIGILIDMLEKEYERLNKIYLDFANQTMRVRELKG